MQPCPFREAARREGRVHYSTARLCRYGHLSPRFTSTGACKECGRLAQAKHSKTPKGVTYRRKWRSQPHIQERDRQYSRSFMRRYLYGITDEEFERMKAAAGGCCEICRNEFKGTGRVGTVACLDHDHFTGLTRGVICNRCNRALGLLRDNIEILKSAQAYLEKPRPHSDSSEH
jgi:hypothetical protein